MKKVILLLVVAISLLAYGCTDEAEIVPTDDSAMCCGNDDPPKDPPPGDD